MKAGGDFENMVVIRKVELERLRAVEAYAEQLRTAAMDAADVLHVEGFTVAAMRLRDAALAKSSQGDNSASRAHSIRPASGTGYAPTPADTPVEPLTAKLLPCPFCGSTNIDPEEWASTETTGPGCDDCGACADTIEIWNTRAVVPRVEPCSEADEAIAAITAAARVRMIREEQNALTGLVRWLDAKGAASTVCKWGDSPGTTIRALIEQYQRENCSPEERCSSWLCKCGGEVANSLDRCCFCHRERAASEV